MKRSKASKALLAFHGKSVLKEKYLEKARKYSQLLRTVSNDTAQVMEVLFNNSYLYWGDDDERDSADCYLEEIGILYKVARLQTSIFDGLSFKQKRRWPERFLRAIPVGADLSNVWPQLAQWLLLDPAHGVLQFANTKEARDEIQNVASRLALGEGDKAEQGWKRSTDLKLIAAKTDAPEAWALAVSNDIWTSSMDFNKRTDSNWISRACHDWAEATVAGANSRSNFRAAAGEVVLVPDEDYEVTSYAAYLALSDQLERLLKAAPVFCPSLP